jgi:inner membrane protein
MDNLTHSLVGALLGQMGLKRKTGLGMAALIIGANIPDIDATCTIYGLQSLAMRRGLTHGPVAMILLPVVLTGLLLAYDRWRPNPARLPVRAGWLYLLALIGTLSHPAFDWLNSYGIRLLEPFSSQWFYGDTIFIIDVWMWALLIGGWFWSRRAEKAGGNWQERGQVVVTALAAYIFMNGLITGKAEALARAAVVKNGDRPELVVANPVPLAFWYREILWRGKGLYGGGGYSVFEGLRLDGDSPIGLPDATVDRARQSDANVKAYLFWSRMPVLRRENGKLLLSDQRFANPLARDRFTVDVPQ